MAFILVDKEDNCETIESENFSKGDIIRLKETMKRFKAVKIILEKEIIYRNNFEIITILKELTTYVKEISFKKIDNNYYLYLENIGDPIRLYRIT